jgi:aminopeptidase N
MANHVRFHAADGSGYDFLSEQVIALYKLNSQVAARIARAFDRREKSMQAGRRTRAQRSNGSARHRGSRRTSEIVAKALS